MYEDRLETKFRIEMEPEEIEKNRRLLLNNMDFPHHNQTQVILNLSTNNQVYLQELVEGDHGWSGVVLYKGIEYRVLYRGKKQIERVGNIALAFIKSLNGQAKTNFELDMPPPHMLQNYAVDIETALNQNRGIVSEDMGSYDAIPIRSNEDVKRLEQIKNTAKDISSEEIAKKDAQISIMQEQMAKQMALMQQLMEQMNNKAAQEAVIDKSVGTALSEQFMLPEPPPNKPKAVRKSTAKK